jgi:hypothetical protein
MMDAEQVEVTVEASRGLRIVAGSPRWSAPARARQALSADLTLAGDGAGEQRLTVAATLFLKDDLPQSGAAIYALNPAARVAAPDIPRSRRVQAADGRQLLEIPAAAH